MGRGANCGRTRPGTGRPATPYGEAAGALADAGLDVHTWVVLAHNSRLGADHPDTSVVNAYGDRYPWAPASRSPPCARTWSTWRSRRRCGPGARGTELESCGWYGLAHLHAHDKIGGVALGDAAQYLMSLCFCADCRAGYGEQGLDADGAAGGRAAALAPVWRGDGSDGAAGRRECRRGHLGAGRTGVATPAAAPGGGGRGCAGGRAAASRSCCTPVPRGRPVGANVGVDPADVLAHADGVVLPCTGVRRRVPRCSRRSPRTGGRGPCSPPTSRWWRWGAPRSTLAEDAAHAAGGRDESRLYHAGLASDGDWWRCGTALARLG